MGYTQSEIDGIQEQWGLHFPPDLIDIMKDRRPLRGFGFDWLRTPHADIERTIARPLESFWFDVREAGLWWSEWGVKPKTVAEQRARLEEVFARAPKLIPLYGHRYLPETPHENGNPVFSVYQSDVIYYGADLADWLVCESGQWESGRHLSAPLKEIPFWSEAVRKNNAR